MNTIERPHPTGRTAMDPIAVIGLGCRLPKAPDPEALWNLLIQGKSGISETPPDRWSVDELYDPLIGAPGKMNTRWGGFIDDIERFDAQFFGIAPREANEMDPQQRALLEVAWAALERGGIRPSSLSGTRTGVYVGIGGNDYSHRGLLLDAHLERINPYTGVGNAHSIAANRLSYFLDLRGPSVAVDTACSSSLVAVHLACASLLARESDVALAGGVNALLSPEVSIAFSHAHMLAGDGRCKAFDASADGYVRGEGCGIVVLKRLADAQRDGNRVFAVIRGVAVNQDGRSNGLTAPNGVAQEAVIRAALRAAGLQPSDIGYVEAHGTGTPLGDPIEMRALTAVLSEGRSPENVCAVGSIKTNIGHLETASGIAGLVKSILALEREQIPPHLHLRKLNELMGLTEGTFVIPREARPWPRGERPRRAGVSSYGFGGTNAHVIVEEAPRAAVCASPESAAYLLCLSARTERSLKRLATAFADDLTRRPDLNPAAVCSTVGLGRDHFAAHRLAVAGASLSELTEKLACLADGRAIPGAWEAAPPPGRRRVAFLFSGQGFQVTGMGRELYVALAAFRDTIEHCARILDPLLGVPLAALLFDDVESARLHQTRFAQPALFAFEYALFVTWKSWGVQPDVVLGHSLGELVAATAAGALELEDALRLVSERARLMQALPAGGGMLAVAADEQQVVRALSRFPSLGRGRERPRERGRLRGHLGAHRDCRALQDDSGRHASTPGVMCIPLAPHGTHAGRIRGARQKGAVRATGDPHGLQPDGLGLRSRRGALRQLLHAPYPLAGAVRRGPGGRARDGCKELDRPARTRAVHRAHGHRATLWDRIAGRIRAVLEDTQPSPRSIRGRRRSLRARHRRGLEALLCGP